MYPYGQITNKECSNREENLHPVYGRSSQRTSGRHRRSIFTLKTRNKILWLAMIGSLLLTTAILKIPFLANAFGFTPVGLVEYGIAMALAILVIPIVEVVKAVQRKLGK